MLNPPGQTRHVIKVGTFTTALAAAPTPRPAVTADQARMDNEGGHAPTVPQRATKIDSSKIEPSSPAVAPTPDYASSAMPTAMASTTIDPSAEGEYWKSNHSNRPYFILGYAYDEYEPAYRFGWESVANFQNESSFDAVEPSLARGWEIAKGKSKLAWDHAKHATRDAWDRAKKIVHNATAPGTGPASSPHVAGDRKAYS